MKWNRHLPDKLSESAMPGIAYQFVVDYGTDQSSDPRIDDIVRVRSSGMFIE